MSESTWCHHCDKEIEPFNGYDYATRGPMWRHVATGSAWCRTTVATLAQPSPSNSSTASDRRPA